MTGEMVRDLMIDMDKETFVINVSHREINAAGAGSRDVTFRCLDSNDGDL
jgi:hypothetical protein